MKFSLIILTLDQRLDREKKTSDDGIVLININM